MKPKDLKAPFRWEERRPVLCDRVLYVPEYYTQCHEYAFPDWSNPLVFGRTAPIEVEYCAGNGEWIIEKARACPERNWVAVELQFEKVRKIWSKMRNFDVTNLLIVCGEALAFTTHYVHDGVFAAAYVNFPDPWPKMKHAKNRLLKKPFLEQVSRVLKPGALFTVATDHAGYAQETIACLEDSSLWESKHAFPHYITDYPGYGTSYFDALWRSQGLQVHYIQYENCKQ